ncbi:Murein DD-endopeptidase MepM [Acaryochloris thomasi RCC1774]|uniref:Murein DD-endopeptidase MepM n=1 Tax=Acaryochloris thomasi RCC1774 TaxID=1764569 RepID=A0A2W1JFA0_9CYAN|nr:M23 family metallopeptidase [Acaryochloris thomasi]PZD72298.1 Murein DD-endopeptidase MepM [Acaryochloris thomasi RCC1774]
MPQQPPTDKPSNRVRSTPLLLLWTWISLMSGLSHLSLSALEAQAADLIIPVDSPPAARPAAPKPVIRSAPAPKPVIRSAPAPKPVVRSAPAPKPVVRSAPAPKPVVKPAPIIQSAPVGQQLAPPASSGASTQPQTKPSVIIKSPVPTSQPIAKPNAIPSAPQAKRGNPLIDTSRNYDLGATQAKPYVKPNRVVVSERSSGCQAVVGRSVSSSICGGGTPPARVVRVQPARAVAQQQAAPIKLRQPYIANRFQSRSAAANVQRGLTPASAPTFAAKPYQQGKSYKAKAYKGANPLKWLLSDGKQMIFPLSIPARISSAFGWRVHPLSGQQRFHSGTDIAAPMGTPVVAAYDGNVAIANYLGGYGLSVLLHHNKGEHATRYAHLSEIFVQPGQVVDQGTVIGLVGSTGHSTGPHLHFEAMQRTPQGYALIDTDIQVEVALSVLVEAIQVAQQPGPQSETVESVEKNAFEDRLLQPQLQARAEAWTSPLDYTLTE